MSPTQPIPPRFDPARRPRSLPPAADKALRVLGAALLDKVEELADRFTVTMVARDPVYSELNVVNEFRASSLVTIRAAVEVISGQVPEGVDPSESSQRTGQLRARQGVPLESVLIAYRVGGRMIWESLLKLSRVQFDGAYDDALLDAAAYVWRISDGSSNVVVDAYRREAMHLHSLDLTRRHTMLDGLIDGRGGDQGFVRNASTVLGIPVTGPLLCVVALGGPDDKAGLRGHQEALTDKGLVAVFHQRPHDEAGIVALGRRSARVAIDALRPCTEGRVGISPLLGGLASVESGYQMAQTAARTLTTNGLATLDEWLPEALIVETPQLSPRLTHVAFGALMELPTADRDILLETLDAVLDCSGSPTRTAAALYCHRNTVISRMRRIETATGRSLANSRDRLLLTLGLMALRYGQNADERRPAGR